MPYLVFIPEAYGDRATSGFTATVQKGVNKVKFDLRSDFSPPSAGRRAVGRPRVDDDVVSSASTSGV